MNLQADSKTAIDGHYTLFIEDIPMLRITQTEYRELLSIDTMAELLSFGTRRAQNYNVEQGASRFISYARNRFLNKGRINTATNKTKCFMAVGSVVA